MRQPPSVGALAAMMVPVAAVVAVDPAGWYPFGPAKFGAVATASLIAIAARLWSARSQPITGIARTTGWLWIAFGAWLSLAAAFGVDGWYALIGTPERRLGLLTWGLFGGAWWVGTQLDRRGERFWSRGVVVAGVWCGGYALIELVWRAPVETSSITDRLGGPFGSAAYFGAALCLLIPVAGGVLADRHEGRTWRTLAGVAVVTGVVGLLGSGTRGAWLGIMCSALVLAVAVRPSRRAVVFGGAVLVAGGVIMLPSLSRLADRDGAGSSRVDEWSVAARVIMERPLLGAGPEGYRLVVRAGIDDHYEQTYGRGVQPDRAHSGPLDIAAIAGLPAMAAYLGLGALAAIAAVRGMRSDDPIRMGLGAGVIAYGVQQLVLFPLAEVDPIYWLAVGILMRPTQEQLDEEPSRFRAGASIGMRSGAVLVASLAVGVFTISVVGVTADRLARDAIRGDATAATRAVELRPDVVRYHLLVASLAAGEQSVAGVDAEISAAQRAADLAPRDPIAEQTLARALLHRAEVVGSAAAVEAAIDAWQQLAIDDPHCQPCFLGLGSALLFADDVGSRGAAVAALERAAALSRAGDDRAQRALDALGGGT